MDPFSPSAKIPLRVTMRHYHRMILRMLPGPIIASLSLLMFLLVMQFLIKYLPDLVGKDLPVQVLIELVSYNLAYMFVLAVPMSILIAILMTFSRLVDTNAYAVIKSSGVSFPQLVWPALVVGALFAGGMVYFNNEVLPEANFRAKNLWKTIHTAKPGFELKPGVFYDDIDQYKILVGSLNPHDANQLNDVTIFDYTDGSRFKVEINAKRGLLESAGDGSALNLELFDGEIHRRKPPGSGPADRYERMAFERHRLQISTEDLNFDRPDPTSGLRNDRSMPSRMMIPLIDSVTTIWANEKQSLAEVLADLGNGNTLFSTSSRVLSPSERARVVTPKMGLSEMKGRRLLDLALQQARTAQTNVERSRSTYNWTSTDANRMRVEIHKKNSIALACLIFVLIGAPLGLTIRRGGLGVAAAAAVAIFLFYWVTLVIGEKLADDGKLEPWIGMWTGNVVTGIIGLSVLLYITLDWQAVRLPWRVRLTKESGNLEG